MLIPPAIDTLNNYTATSLKASRMPRRPFSPLSACLWCALKQTYILQIALETFQTLTSAEQCEESVRTASVSTHRADIVVTASPAIDRQPTGNNAKVLISLFYCCHFHSDVSKATGHKANARALPPKAKEYQIWPRPNIHLQLRKIRIICQGLHIKAIKRWPWWWLNRAVTVQMAPFSALQSPSSIESRYHGLSNWWLRQNWSHFLSTSYIWSISL